MLAVCGVGVIQAVDGGSVCGGRIEDRPFSGPAGCLQKIYLAGIGRVDMHAALVGVVDTVDRGAALQLRAGRKPVTCAGTGLETGSH